MDNILKNKNILILVTGSIAIYKILDLISNLKKMEAKTAVVMSDEALNLIQPLCFEALSNKEVLYSKTQSHSKDSPNHISYALWADIAILAPASVNSIAKLRYGIADTLVLSTLFACQCPILIAPSANINMMESIQNKQNLKDLSKMGYTIIPPRETLLACNIVAKGAMATIDEIIFHIKKSFIKKDFWINKDIVITGGGSIEQIDNIRHISNNSSGLQSSNLALIFYLLGAKVRLISSKFPLTLPLDINITNVKSNNDFRNALKKYCKKDSILIMAAAISDFIVQNPKNEKIKKEDIGKSWNLELIQDEDILSNINCAFKVGFKAESNENIAESKARKMLQPKTLGGKDCDLVVLNIINDNNKIGSNDNEITIFSKDSKIFLSKKDKFSISFEIANIMEKELQSR
ncbi:bifunctional phosphopantothenoylcysteine decarboxylase/phosphopantothenate--cysteine ligase CoaBC [Helicobacter sp. 16-1353]|uniref:bifunctional phosphopantothenoylcysteine decarboxylase/phosphopantothenate--cysteine ligase CoaBC n=1 Tax=Helicobacter sp. 16-1353 TaxID=2004996 RepID=UPI0015EE4187|nr:bifunctional phosphopantothenoylcysteine decarboxylase/phosphopantothenate--cysteine ligase CoaBC [Helicobacter sp. 16-1353]